MNNPYTTSTPGAASTARRDYTVRRRHASNAAAGGSQCSVRTGLRGARLRERAVAGVRGAATASVTARKKGCDMKGGKRFP